MRLSRWTRVTALVAAGAMGLALTACSTKNNDKPANDNKAPQATTKKLSIVATTGYLADAIKNVAPNAEVKTLVGPGGDPHTQPLTTADVEAMNKADAVIWTSHDMEHQMMAKLDTLGDKQIPAAESIPKDMLLPWEEDGKIEGHDPHVWNSPDAWKHVVTAIAKKLGEIDKDGAEVYKKNAEDYNAKIDAAKEEAKKKFDAIPQANRILITGHDAFNYLGKTYGIEIRATDFVSSEAQISAAELEELAKFIAEKKIPVIFQDNLSNPDAVNHLKESVKAKGWDVEVSGKALYADSLGETAPTDTYLGVFKYNADAISEALTPKK